MLVADVPNESPSIDAVTIVADKENQESPKKRWPVLGVCTVTNRMRGGQKELFPVITANMYLRHADHKKFDYGKAKVVIVQQPKHGMLEPNPSWAETSYLLNDNYYRGQDFVALQVEENQLKIEIHYFIEVYEDAGLTISNPNPICNGHINDSPWLISFLMPNYSLQPTSALTRRRD